jgi:hypothetical protein
LQPSSAQVPQLVTCIAGFCRKHEVRRWRSPFSPDLCREGVNNLIARWNKCRNEQGGTDMFRIITVRLKMFSQKKNLFVMVFQGMV